MVKIENENFLVQISEVGALLTSFYDKRRKKEILKGKGENGWLHQDVIQFPVIGPGPISIGGVKRDIGQHGFARFEKYEVKEAKKDSATLLLSPNEENKDLYPFDFSFEVTISLKGESILYHFHAANHGEENMPFMVGSHIGFKTIAGVSYIDLDRDEYFPLVNGIVQTKKAKFPLGKRLPVSAESFAPYDTVVMVNEGKSVYTLHIGDGYRYVYRMDAPLTAIWTAEGSGEFVCIEPWWGNSLYAGRPEALEKRDYLNWCGPHASKDFSYSIDLLAE